MKCGIVVHERYFWHQAGNVVGIEPAGINARIGRFNEPLAPFESPSAKRRIWNLVQACNLDAELVRIAPRSATVDELCLFHTREYVDRVHDLSLLDAGGDAGECAKFMGGSFEIATLAAGGVFAAVDAVMRGAVKRVYCLVRPPGHHAERDRGRGFCLFNNVALGAMYTLKAFPEAVKRIAIVDYDVHHGNGTQQAFYDSNQVLFISMHQDRLYPCEGGLADERGTGAGLGFNVNVPLPPGSGVGAYDAVFDEIVIPALEAFKPDLIFVSSGFDAAAFDTLGRMQLPSSSFGSFARKLCAVGSGRVIAAHEGGYDEILGSFCGLRVIEALADVEHSPVVDPFETEISGYVTQALQTHQRSAIDAAKSKIDFLALQN
jgi:acetoin utilization deacetylase AcuC-like enzyme